MLKREYIVLLGDFSTERIDFAAIGREFSWTVAPVAGLADLDPLRRSGRIVAVIFQAGALDMSWRKAVRTVRAELPEARILLGHHAGQSDARTEMVENGVFVALLLPLARAEVRQALGFVWASGIMSLKPAAARKVRSIDARARRAGAA